MSIAIEELREWAEINAADEAAGDAFLDEPQGPNGAHFLHVVEALDLLEEALAEATALADRQADGGLEAVVQHFVRRFNNIAHEMEQLRQDVG